MEYIILSDSDFKELERKVNEKIKEGWQPIGGIDSNVFEGGLEYLQAMIFKRDS